MFFMGEMIAVFPSIAEAATFTVTNSSSISACCLHKQHTAGGFEWEYEGNANSHISRQIEREYFIRRSLSNLV